MDRKDVHCPVCGQGVTIVDNKTRHDAGRLGPATPLPSPPTLEQAAWSRGVDGWDEPVVQGGQVVAYRRRYSDAMLKLLIDRLPPSRTPGERRATAEATDRALLRKLDAIAARERARRRTALVAWADDMAARGWAP